MFVGAVLTLLHDNFLTIRQALRERREEKEWLDEYSVTDSKPIANDRHMEIFLDDIKKQLKK